MTSLLPLSTTIGDGVWGADGASGSTFIEKWFSILAWLFGRSLRVTAASACSPWFEALKDVLNAFFQRERRDIQDAVRALRVIAAGAELALRSAAMSCSSSYALLP